MSKIFTLLAVGVAVAVAVIATVSTLSPCETGDMPKPKPTVDPPTESPPTELEPENQELQPVVDSTEGSQPQQRGRDLLRSKWANPGFDPRIGGHVGCQVPIGKLRNVAG